MEPATRWIWQEIAGYAIFVKAYVLLSTLAGAGTSGRLGFTCFSFGLYWLIIFALISHHALSPPTVLISRFTNRRCTRSAEIEVIE